MTDEGALARISSSRSFLSSRSSVTDPKVRAPEIIPHKMALTLDPPVGHYLRFARARRREEQRRNRKVKGMFWASLHFSSELTDLILFSFFPTICELFLVTAGKFFWLSLSLDRRSDHLLLGHRFRIYSFQISLYCGGSGTVIF